MAPASTASRAAPGRGTPEPAAAEPGVPESPASWSAGTSWDETRSWDAGARWEGTAAEVGGAPANGNHYVSQPGDEPPGTAVAETPDAATAEAIRRDPFSTAWLRDEELTSPPDTESGWPDRAEAGPQAAAADSWFTPREKADDERTWHDAGAEIQRPAASPPEGQAISRAAWPAPAETPAGDPPGAAAAEGAPSRTIAGPTVPPGPVVPPGKSRPDRLYPVRLLVVIVVAALIGSILVLLLR